jgi:hypothetical protein
MLVLRMTDEREMRVEDEGKATGRHYKFRSADCFRCQLNSNRQSPRHTESHYDCNHFYAAEAAPCVAVMRSLVLTIDKNELELSSLDQ